MKQFIIIALAVLSLQIVNAQDAKVDPRFSKFMDKVVISKGGDTAATHKSPLNANNFYKTYEDYVAGNAAPEIILTDGHSFGGKPTLYVKQNGVDKKIKINELGMYWGYCNQFGLLCRIFDGHSYLILTTGKVWQYLDYDECNGTLNKDSTFSLTADLNPQGTGEGGYEDYASVGANGPVLNLECKFKGKCDMLEQLTSDHPEIYKEYLEDKTYYLTDKYKEHQRKSQTFKIQHALKKYNRM